MIGVAPQLASRACCHCHAVAQAVGVCTVEGQPESKSGSSDSLSPCPKCSELNGSICESLMAFILFPDLRYIKASMEIFLVKMDS